MWRKRTKESPEVAENGHLEEADEAVHRAKKASEDAETDLQEMRELARRAVAERSENHFAPEIEEAMRRKTKEA